MAKALEHLPATVTAGIRRTTFSLLVLMTWKTGQVFEGMAATGRGHLTF